MLFQISLMDILSPVQEATETEKIPAKQSPMKKLAARLDLSVLDLWIVIFTILGLAVIYAIGEIALRLSK